MLIRGTAILLGVGLLALWVVALATGQAAWITWLDFAIAVVMILQAALPYGAESGVTLVLALGLFALWIIALAVGNVAGWLMWITFAFGCAYLAFSAYAAYGTGHRARPTTPQFA